MKSILDARTRYAEMRRGLDLSREVDRVLHTELGETIQMLDRKIAEGAPDKGDAQRARRVRGAGPG